MELGFQGDVQINVQSALSAQPAQAVGAAETNQKHAHALLVALRLFDQCKAHYGD
jgi:hypothetical protein